MALNGQDMELFLSVDGSLDDPQPDPNDSLGGTKSSDTVEEVESTVTTAGDVYTFTDSAQTSTSHVGKWVVFVTGAAAYQARRVVYHDTGTGDMGFAPGYDNAPGVGDVYRVFGTATLFDDVAAAEAAAGYVDYRLVFFNNNTGEQLTDIRAWLEPLEPAGTELRLAVGDDNAITPAVDVIADEETEPELNPASGLGSTRQFWRQPLSFAQAEGAAPNGGAHSLTNGRRLGIWLERSVVALSRQRTAAAWLLNVEALSASPSGGGPYRTSMVVAYDVVGFTPQLAVLFDRTPRTFGGAAITARLLDADQGFAVQGEDLTLTLEAPSPGTLQGGPTLTTDASGEVALVYQSPEDEAEVGSDVEIQAALGGF